MTMSRKRFLKPCLRTAIKLGAFLKLSRGIHFLNFFQSYSTFSTGKTETSILLSTDFKAWDEFTTEVDIGNHISDFIPRNLNVVLQLRIIVKFEGLISDHNISVNRPFTKPSSLSCVRHFRIERFKPYLAPIRGHQ